MLKNVMSSLLPFVCAATVLAVPAAPASAYSAGYRAEPLSPPAVERLVVKDLVWKCGVTGCVAGKSNSRPTVDCAALAREIGPLRNFAVGGAPIAGDALEKCNARAR